MTLQTAPRWLLVLAALLLLGFATWLWWPAPPGPRMKPKQAKATAARVSTATQKAAQQDKRAAIADSTAAAAATHATTLRHATHAQPPRRLPTAPAAVSELADSLARVLTNY